MTRHDFQTKILPLKDKLFRFAYRIVSDVAEAEDIVQEIFIKFWNNREHADQIANTEAWCIRATKNLSIDKLRSKHRRTESLPDTFEMSDNGPTPYGQTLEQDVFSKVKKLMDNLPEKQRLVMQLRDIEDMSYQEIADALDISIDQVKVNIFRARTVVRKGLMQLNLTPKSF